MADADEQARRWAALNRIRELRPVAYEEHVRYVGQKLHFRTAGLSLLGIAAVLAVGLALLAVLGGATALDVVLLALIPGILAAVGAVFLVVQRRADREQAVYDARAVDRERWRDQLARWADQRQGSTSAGSVDAAVRFLLEHCPDPAPQAFVTPLAGERSDRFVAVAQVEGHPVLVEVIDTGPASGGWAPPTVGVLVAGPGVWALRDDADDLVTVDALDLLVKDLIADEDRVPRSEPLPRPAPSRETAPAGRDEVVEHFLRALRDGDLYAAFACADTRLGVGRLLELTPEELGTATAAARPSSWKRTGVTSGGAATYRFAATVPGRRSSADVEVHVVEEGRRWRVCGYQVAGELLCGIAHDWSD